MPVTPVIDVSRVEKWPADPYGYDHGQETGNHAEAIGNSLGLSGEELTMCRVVGVLHDVGRLAPWWQPEADHAARSAKIARDVLMIDPSWVAEPDMIERVCRIIALHSISGPVPRDPIARALRDADLLEAARLAPGEPTGDTLVRERYALLETPWARLPHVQKTILRNRSKGKIISRPWLQGE